MTKIFVNDWIAADGTLQEDYNANWVADTNWASNGNSVASVIISNTLRRPSSQTSSSHRVTLYSATTPDDCESVVDFSLVGYTTTSSNVGTIVRANAGVNNGYLARYRPNTGYQLFRQSSGTSTQLGSTNTTDLNPTGMSFASPLRRRIRLRVVGSNISVFLDTWNGSAWTVGITPIITTTDTNHTTGSTGLWFTSSPTDQATPTDGFIVNEWYVDDLVSSGGQPPVITSSLTASGTVGLAFSYQIVATNSPTSYNATGLPSGLTVNTTTGLISGTPTTAATTNVSISATNADGTDTETLVITVAPTGTPTPNAPTGLSVRSFTPGRTDTPLNQPFFTYTDTLDNKLHLQWITPSNQGSSAISSYRIESSVDGSTGWTLVRNTGNNQTVAYNITRNPGAIFYRVAAVNSSGLGVFSNVLNVPASTSTVDGTLVRDDGVWTFFTHPRAVCYRGFTYIGWVDSRGVVGVTKVNNATLESTHFDLEDLSAVRVQLGGAEIDDHDNAAIYIREDGRITCYYGAHNDPAGIRSRTTVYPEDITSWSPAIVDSPATTITNPDVILPTTYSNPRYIRDSGLMMYHFRTGTPPNAPHAILFTNTQDNPNNVASYTEGLPLIQSTQSPWSSQRPYVHSIVNGSDRVDFFTTDGHPGDSGTANNGNGTSVYHFYALWDNISKKVRYYRSNGEEIVNPNATGDQIPSLPIRPKVSGGGSDATQIWNGVNIRAWTWDIIIGFDGHPRVLFTTYDNGSGSFGFTNQRYRFSRWTGTAWTTPVDICGQNVASTAASIRGQSMPVPSIAMLNVNHGLANEPAYSGGVCFDANNPNIVYASVPVVQTPATNPALSTTDPGGIREIQEWRTNDNGLTWAKHRDITTNTPPNITNGRPYSPKNHDGRIAVVWFRGAYSGWVRNFNTNLWVSPSVQDPLQPSDLAPIGARLALTRLGQIIPLGF